MKKKKNNKVKKRQLNNKKELIITFISIISILIFSAIIFKGKMGFFGKYIGGAFFALFGISAYVFPLIFIFLFLKIFLSKDKKVNIKLIMFILLYISTLLILANYYDKGITFKDKINNSLLLAKDYRGAGIFPTTLYFIINKVIGDIGIYIVFLIIFIISFIVFLDEDFTSIISSIRKMFSSIKLKFKNRKEKKERKKVNEASLKNNKILEPAKKLELEKENIIINTHDELEKNDSDHIHGDLGKESKKEKTSNVKEEEELNIEGLNYIEYIKPPIDLLKEFKSKGKDGNDILLKNAETIEDTLKSFSIQSEVVTINRGPTVTSYELKPQAGVKVSRIVNLSNDLSLALATSGIRIEAPIPGKPYVGIEVPNKNKDMVSFKELLLTDDFQAKNNDISVALGRNISGKPIIGKINDMPHVLVAGATGSGKSVCINTVIMSILYKYSPNDVRMLLIDPKIVELSIYNGIPHLLTPVVTDAKKSATALNSVVKEMVRRFKLFSTNSCRDIKSYNEKAKESLGDMEHLPYIVVIIDELSDLMMEAPAEIEDYITRLAQMGRASGIHLIVATQRPSVDVITGIIKANIPSRISFQVSSQIDSRTILDSAGAEKLLGKGDMLYHPSSLSKPIRVQGAFISSKEVESVVSFIKKNNEKSYDEEMLEEIESKSVTNSLLEDADSLLEEAIEFVITENQASISAIQRRFRVGYARAGRIVDQMENLGVISGHEGSKPRKVLVDKNYLEKKEGNPDVI